MQTINIIIIGLLIVIAYQDIRFREVSWLVFPIILVLNLIRGLMLMSPVQLLSIAGINMLFLVTQFLVLLLIMVLKNGLPIDFRNSIGLADIFLLFASTLLFSNMNFICTYTGGLIFSLIVWGIKGICFPDRGKLIPLAGFFSLFLIMVMIFDILSGHFNSFNDNLLINLING
jgi:hypothetical protein